MGFRVGFLALVLARPGLALVSPDGTTGRLPAMGWNSWNDYGCNINETVFITVGNLINSLGLKDLGYNYVNIDDCWSNKTVQRDNSTGQILPDYNKFPRGMKHVADEVHKLGLKLGIYSDAGSTTCAHYAGSLGHEVLDANTWAEWGIDCSSTARFDNVP
jgi:alpha-galactosidase